MRAASIIKRGRDGLVSLLPRTGGRRRRRARIWSIAYSLAFAGLLLSTPSRGSDPNQFESSPIRDNEAQAAWLRQKAREAQEQYRLRVAIPRKLKEGEPDKSSSRNDNVQGKPAAAVEPAEAHLQDMCLGALLCLLGLAAVRHFAPDATSAFFARLNPWSADLSFKEQLAAEALDDERAFAEFVVAFKAGPVPAPDRSQTVSNLEEPPTVGTNSASDVQVDPLNAFFVQGSAQVLAMQCIVQGIRPDVIDRTRQSALDDLVKQLQVLQEMAVDRTLLPVWQVASALGGLLKQLSQRACNVTPHSIQTVGSGLRLLNDLCQPGVAASIAGNATLRLLAVDDDPISRHAVGFALKKAFNQPDVAANSEAALAQTSMIAYDIIFLDILMPGMDGFELCSAIRKSSLNRNTPVVFVTTQSGFDARAKSHLSGGEDLIAKPFLAFELAVKALTLGLRAKLDKQKNGSPGASAPETSSADAASVTGKTEVIQVPGRSGQDKVSQPSASAIA
jgi:CheY-like chemotaxis protein